LGPLRMRETIIKELNLFIDDVEFLPTSLVKL
jgi:hypothetical protein